MSKTPLRDQITAYLSTVEEATATQIAKRTTEKDYPSRVLRELNAMRTDALIECGKLHKGPDLSYWLAQTKQAEPAPEQKPATNRIREQADQRRQIIRAAIAGKAPDIGPAAKDLAAACGVTVPAIEQLVAPMLASGHVGKARNEGERFYRLFDPAAAVAKPQPEVGKNTGSDGSDLSGSKDSTEAVAVQEPAPPPAAATAAAGAEDESVGLLAVISTIRASLPGGDRLMLTELAAAVREQFKRSQRAEALERDAAEVHSARKVIAKHDELLAEVANAKALADKLQHLLDSKTHECEALRAELARTQQDGEQAIDVKDAATGYLVKAPKRKPRILTKPESAHAAAMACARNGSGRGDVYALVYIGSARRGAEWKAA